MYCRKKSSCRKKSYCREIAANSEGGDSNLNYILTFFFFGAVAKSHLPLISEGGFKFGGGGIQACAVSCDQANMSELFLQSRSFAPRKISSLRAFSETHRIIPHLGGQEVRLVNSLFVFRKHSRRKKSPNSQFWGWGFK